MNRRSLTLGKRTWTAAEDAKLRAEYGTRLATDIARELKRTPDGVMQHARIIGLVSPISGRSLPPQIKRHPLESVFSQWVHHEALEARP